MPSEWNFARKHYRLELLNGRFLKVNRFEDRMRLDELQEYCVKYAPRHVFMSVMDWLRPEQVGKKQTANHALPIGGQYVVDVDHYVICAWHNHYFQSSLTKICLGCLEKARRLAVDVCERIERYYSDVAVVFSGARGFHVWVFDFNIADWTKYDSSNPIKSYEVARLKFTRLLLAQSHGWNRDHFILSVDPMRVMTVPGSLNAVSGLMCSYIGKRQDLEKSTTRTTVEAAKPTMLIHGHPSLTRR